MSEKCSKEYDNSMIHGEKEQLNKKTERRIIGRKNKVAESKSEKNSRRALVALTCLMAVVTIVVVVLGGFSDVFDQGGDEKAVAVLILPQEDKEELEKHLAKLWPLINVGFDTEKMSEEEIFSHIRPYCEDGLYTSFGYSSVAITHESDPAMRFRDENGSYCYYKIPAEEIDNILGHFGFETNHAINNEKCYFYNSYYYFAAGQAEGSKSNVKVTVLDNKRIQDGRYYVTASFGSQKAYVIASMGEREEGSYWKIHSMSLEPVFDSLGIKIKTDDETANRYEMRIATFEGIADDGTLYSRYSVKYPYFFGDSQGEIQANAFYHSIITYYQQQSQQVQTAYKKFIKKGGEKASLPIEYHYTALVSRIDEENLCIISEIVESLPVYKASEDASVSVELPEKTIECYTFDLKTGSYVSKDEFVGKDSKMIAEILYRIYKGYEYETITGGSLLSVQVPEDSGKIGEKIYNSASTLCNDGYVFCFVNNQGIREDVVIPFDVLDKLTETTEE